MPDRPLLVVAALALACVANAVHAAASRPLPQPRIVNGVFTSQYPTVAAVLKGSNPDTAAQWCTATLIGCETVLTAAHCVCDGTGASCQAGGPHEPTPSRYSVFLQHAGAFAVASIAVNPSYDGDVADVAVLRLAAPVTGIPPTPINRTVTPPHGTTGTIVGFGRQGGSYSDYGLKREGTVSLAACPNDVSNVSSVCWDFDQPLGAPGTDSNTCHGDSGGPLFVDFGCGPVVAGITTDGVNAECVTTDHSWDVNVYNYREFIEAAGGADLDRTTCGDGPQVGDPNVTVQADVGSMAPNLPDGLHTIVVPAGTTELRVTLNAVDTTSVYENFDLYLRFGGAPTLTTYDCKAAATNQFGACAIAAPTAGTWYALVHRANGTGTYQLTSTIFPSGTPGAGLNGVACDDGRLCTANDLCHAGQCMGTPAPMPACRQPNGRSRSQLVLRNVADDNRDLLKWNWARSTIPAADLGDPAGSTNYEVCLFDEQADAPRLAFHTMLPAGAGWTRSPAAITFRDGSGANDGVSLLKLRAGAGNASIRLRAHGTTFPTPSLPLTQDPRVLIQVGNGAACWEARFSSSIHNKADQFRAHSD